MKPELHKALESFTADVAGLLFHVALNDRHAAFDYAESIEFTVRRVIETMDAQAHD